MTASVVKVGVAGAAGRMGRMLVAQLAAADGLALAAALEAPGHPQLGRDAGELAGVEKTGVALSDDLEAAAPGLDLLLDFTLAPATARNLEICAASQTPMVIGTTGLDAAQLARLHEIGKTLPVVHASNYSVGVNAAFKLAEMAARIFGDTADIEIVEAHHRHKRDAPSGTALTLGERAAKALGRDLGQVAIQGRAGVTGERDAQTIAFHALRGGDLVGEHSILFLAQGERLEITHRAHSRQNFAEGALRAARWLLGRPPGLYNMMQVLDLED